MRGAAQRAAPLFWALTDGIRSRPERHWSERGRPATGEPSECEAGEEESHRPRQMRGAAQRAAPLFWRCSYDERRVDK